MGFHGRAAAHKPKITMYTAKHWLEWCKVFRHLALEQWKCVLDDSVLPTLWQQFGEGPLLFQDDNAPVHKARSIQKLFVEIGVEELDWPAQNGSMSPQQCSNI